MLTKANKDGWTAERIERLKTLWAEGYSAAQIARELKAQSRSAVIGKVHRLGLSGRITRHRDPPCSKRKLTPKFNFATVGVKKAAPPVEREPYVYRETVVTPPEQRLNFDDLVDGRCKYAHGDSHPYTFCGAKAAVPGGVWCPTHFQVVTGAQPPKQLSGNSGEFEPLQNLQQLEAVS